MQKVHLPRRRSICSLENINGGTENDSISIPMQVTPGFLLGVFALAAVTLRARVIATRSRILYLFGASLATNSVAWIARASGIFVFAGMHGTRAT
jgi:hypothetical protein